MYFFHRHQKHLQTAYQIHFAIGKHLQTAYQIHFAIGKYLRTAYQIHFAIPHQGELRRRIEIERSLHMGAIRISAGMVQHAYSD